MDKLIDIAKKVNNNIPADCIGDFFWVPKKKHIKDKANKLNLYVFGGEVLSIYYDEDGRTKFHANFYEYKNYFGELWTKDFNDELVNNGVGKECLNAELITNLSSVFWKTIHTAYLKRMNGESENNASHYYERGRENLIAANIEKNSINAADSCGFRIIEIESDIPTISKKPDLIGIRKENGGWIISFIEYKSTQNGMKTSLKDHFIDMIKFYNNMDFPEEYSYKNLYEQVMDYAAIKYRQCGIPFDYKSGDKICGEIVFLFSHVGAVSGITEQMVYNNTKRMENLSCYKDYLNSVKFCILKDEKELIDVKAFMDTDSFLSLEIFSKCLKDQWKITRKKTNNK